MPQQIIVHDCPLEVRQDVEMYWDRKMLRIDRLLSHMPADQRHLHLTVKHCRDDHEVHGVLTLPTGTLVAQGSSPSHREAMDLVADKLAHEIQRHLELVRRDYVYRRRGRRSQAYLTTAAEAAHPGEVQPLAEEAPLE
jgi:ribosome-associated translation inhibitor RaiA